MYQYKVVPIGGVDTLRHRMGTGDGIQVARGQNDEEALEEALNAYAAEGWYLKQVLQPDLRGLPFLCVMERLDFWDRLEQVCGHAEAKAGCRGCDAP